MRDERLRGILIISTSTASSDNWILGSVNTYKGYQTRGKTKEANKLKFLSSPPATSIARARRPAFLPLEFIPQYQIGPMICHVYSALCFDGCLLGRFI
jgi:hypothetical protein